MSFGLIMAFLFFAGSLIGWCLEFGYRNLVSHNGPKFLWFINPGFCRGPYLPIYGVGLTTMFIISYLLSSSSAPKWTIVIGIGVTMSLIELFGGWMLLKFLNLRLWDYTQNRGNINGYICPRFSLIWTALGAAYYLWIHPVALNGLIWLSNNLAFSFFIGLFFGVFIIDLYLSNRDAVIIKEFAEYHDVVVKYDELKTLVQRRRLEKAQKTVFFNQTAAKVSDLREIFTENLATFESKIKKRKNR